MHVAELTEKRIEIRTRGRISALWRKQDNDKDQKSLTPLFIPEIMTCKSKSAAG